jgi:hypothetical protein
MSQRPLDPQIAERIRLHAASPGSPSAKASILAWVSRAEAGEPGVGDASSVADLVRALVRLTYSRALFGYDETEQGSHLDIRMLQSDFPNALLIEERLVAFYQLDEAAQRVVIEGRAKVTEEILETLERTFERLFK